MTEFLSFLIEFNQKNSDSISQETRPNTYRILELCAALTALFAIFTLATGSLPSRVHAFWPFYSNADASANTPVPDSKTPVLAAATNVDPNPLKGISANQTMSGNALIASSGPGGTAVDAIGTTQSDRISVYVVRPGDTLSEIAGMYNVSVNTIIWANNLKSIKDVHPGDTLIILPISGVERIIQKGDTLRSLAKKYSADAGEIAQYNGLDPAEPLEVGSTIIIPGGEIPAPTPQARASTIREPFLGGSGAAQPGYYNNPIPGAVLTQGLHGWNGIDLGGARGTPIHAAADGTIIIARSGGWNGGYGNYVVIAHGNGSQTLYSHMRSITVSPGQSVLSGQTIGYVGSTGLSTGPHLHFEVRGAANPFRNCFKGSVCTPQ